MKLATTFALTTATVAVLSGCGRDEPEVYTPVAVAPAETPIYAKDGTVVETRPVVGYSGGSGMDASDDGDRYED